MRIGFFGDGRWARLSLERLRQLPEFKLVYVVGRHERCDEKLRGLARELELPFLTASNVNTTEFVDHIRSLDPDLQVSMSFDQIIDDRLRLVADRGFINCHAGALPLYRGRNILNWAIINGEQRFGVTVHYMDSGIDTGDIIRQEFSSIEPDDDYSDLLRKAETLCAKTLQSALVDLAHGTASRTPQNQIHPVGFYCSRRRDGDEWIDWRQPSKRIHDFVRGIAPPGPGARGLMSGNLMAVLRTELIPEAPAYIDRPGTVVGTGPYACVVKTGNTSIRVTRVADLTSNGELENIRSPQLQIGQRFLGKTDYGIRHLSLRVAELERRLEWLTSEGRIG